MKGIEGDRWPQRVLFGAGGPSISANDGLTANVVTMSDPTKEMFMLAPYRHLWVALTISMISAAGAAPQRDKAKEPKTTTANINVLQYGAKPDGVTDNSAAIQKAVDAAISARWNFGTRGGARVVFPAASHPYLIHKSIFVDAPGVEIAGEGLGSIVQVHPYYEVPAFVFGIPRRVDGKPLVKEAEHRPDGHRVLDASAAPSAGVRRGLRTLGEAALAVPCHALQHGASKSGGVKGQPDRWVDTKQLTIDFLLEKPAGVSWQTWSPFFGVGGPGRHARPWAVSAGDMDDEIMLTIQTSELEGTEHAHAFGISTKGIKSPWRITFSLDLDQGRCDTWINGLAVKNRLFDIVPKDDPRKFKAKLTLGTADGTSQFLIGQAGTHAFGSIGAPVTNLGLYGLKLTRGKLYKPAGSPGTKQSRLDDPSAPIDDLFRYFSSPPAPKSPGGAPPVCIGYLKFDDPPGPTLQVRGETFDGVGFWIPKTPWQHIGQNSVRDLHIFGAGQPAILLGTVLDWRGTNLTIFGSMQAIGSLNLSASYPIRLEGCDLAGSDCAYYGYRQILHARSTTFAQGGRDTVRLKACDSSWRDTLIAATSPDADTAFRFLAEDYGGRHRIEDCIVDNEGGRYASAIVYAEQHSYAAGRLVIDGLISSSIAPGVPMIWLKGFGNDGDRYRECRLDAKGLANANLDHDTIIKVEGLGWSGDLDATQLAPLRSKAAAPKLKTAGEGASKIRIEYPR